MVLREGDDYYLKDIGSKYGTFIEIGLSDDKPLQPGDFLGFDDYYLEIIKIKVYSQKNHPSFDIKIRTFKNSKNTI